MDRQGVLGADRAALVDRLADDVDDAAQRLRADRHRRSGAGVDGLLAADQTVGRVHGDGAHGAFAQMLRHFEHQQLALVLWCSAFRIDGSSPSNCTSTTAPVTWVILPTLFFAIGLLPYNDSLGRIRRLRRRR
jgi:hypothetical protein